ncbi:hypothetical protein [Lacinutrix sp. 5H-3-7-4]|uniref:hypothetical protein n=1 Tax=Lacinutrix sp. (strain 5H-3-7-4) TaxID=983544 RepID=UPI00020A32E9|nr:hypothetical protein [Lacinutrix sp. 5H-3-7-4]AEH02541.1 hypothetical protein Lacal_2701 [Lacinutrix sp. 5H-3-7-4]
MTESNRALINLNGNEETISNIDFTSVVNITYTENVVLEKKKVVFQKCIFRQGIVFMIDLTQTKISELDLMFEDCIIEENKEKNEIKSNKQKQKLFLYFNTCLIRDLGLDKCDFTNASFFKSLILERLLITNSSVRIITIRNCFGSVFINNNPKSKLFIYYADDNLFIENYNLRKVNKLIKKRDSLNKIFSHKTRFHISNTQEISVEFKKSSENGIKRIKNEDKSLKEAKYYLKESELKELDISVSIRLESDITKNIKISNCILNGLSLNGDSNTIIDIKHTTCNRLFIDKFSSAKLLLYDFQATKEDSKLEIKNSDLSNTWFNKVRLNSFDIVSFYRTTLENTKFSATEFPNSIEALENIHYPLEKESEYFNNQYENYKQLKVALANQSDQIQALQMHRKMYEAIRQSKKLSSQDKFILFLNNISNKHGTSITHSFFCFLVILFSLYITYTLALPKAPYSFGWNGFGSFWESICETTNFVLNKWKNLYALANPTHRLSQLIENNLGQELSGMNYFISFCSRILIGWCYYQFVSAFRKFGKKV